MDYDNIMLNDKEPLIKKVMIMDDNTEYGRLLGTLKEDYLNLDKGSIVYIQYTRELLQYMLVISKYVPFINILDPIIVKSFKSVQDLKAHVINIINLLDGDMVAKELCETEGFSVFD